jgi:hypothetical protein
MTAAKDPFDGYPDSMVAQGRRLMVIVPSDVADLPRVPKALLCVGAGNICITSVKGDLQADGDTDLAAGIVIPIGAGDTYDATRVRRVWSTGTTATVYAVL